MAKCKHQSTDGKRCLRPEALLPMCWVYYEYPARREQCKHFEKMVDAKELLEKIDRALMHAQDLLADSLDRHGERDHVAIQKDILAAICAHAVLETRLVDMGKIQAWLFSRAEMHEDRGEWDASFEDLYLATAIFRGDFTPDPEE